MLPGGRRYCTNTGVAHASAMDTKQERKGDSDDEAAGRVAPMHVAISRHEFTQPGRVCVRKLNRIAICIWSMNESL